MIRAIGKYKKYEDQYVLFINLIKTNFDRVKEHVVKNMFFSYKRIAPKYKTLLLTSIGDHLDSNDNQNLKHADVCLEIDIKEDLSKEIIDRLDSHHTWFICIINDKEAFMFATDKETQFIKERRYLPNVE